MLGFYKYLYFRIYSWNLKKWGENDMPEWNAVLGVSFTMFINLFVLVLLFQFVGIAVALWQKESKRCCHSGQQTLKL